MADQEGAIRQRLASALTAAMKGRDAIAASALRSALAAIDNASAVPARPAPERPAPARPAPAAGTGSPHFAGAVAGVGATEALRRYLSETHIEEIVRTEVAERQAAAQTYERAGRRDQADRLRQEAHVLMAAIGDLSTPALRA